MCLGEADNPPASSCRAPLPAGVRRTPGMTQLGGGNHREKKRVDSAVRKLLKQYKAGLRRNRTIIPPAVTKTHTSVQRIVVYMFTPPKPIVETWTFIIKQNV